MLQKTSGIVVSFIKYAETSVIVKIFTKGMGLRSYIVNGVRTSAKSNKMAFFQPLTLLDLVVYEKEGKNIQRISEMKLLRPHQRIPFDFRRSAIAMFVGEVLSKSIVDGYQNESYFDFLVEVVDRLDSNHVLLGHFPVLFLLEGSKHLGFAPETGKAFYMELEPILGSQHAFQSECAYLDLLIEDSFRITGKIDPIRRKNLLDHFLAYYAKHLEIFPDWKSIDVLRQLMHS